MEVHSHRGMMALKIICGIILFFTALIVLIIVIIGTPYFSAKVGTLLTHKSRRNIALNGKIETHLWSREPHITFHQVQVGNAEWSKDPLMFEADRIELSIRPMELLRGRVVLPELILKEPKLVLEKNAKGDANWDIAQNSQASLVKQPVPKNRGDIPVIHHLEITDGQITYRDPTQHINTVLKISSVNGQGEKDQLHVSGNGTYQNQPFILDVTGASILQLRESSAPFPFAIKTVIGPTSAQVQGTVKDPITMEAFDVQLDLKGKNAADLFPLTGIALPPTPAYEVKGHLTRDDEKWNFQKFTGTLGTSDLKGELAWYANQKPPYLRADFISDNLDMLDLKGFVGANDKPSDPDRVIPDAPLDISRLMAMNADATFSSRHVKTPDILDNFAMTLHLKDGTLAIKPVSFGMADGNIETFITIEGKKAPPLITLDTRFNHLSLTKLFKPLAKHYGKENVSAGMLGGKARLEGNGKSLREMLASSNGTVGIGMEGGSLSKLLLDLVGLDIFRSAGLLITGADAPVPISCVVSDFSVSSGIMQTQAFLIDTDVEAIRGKGTINLQNEALDLHFYVFPKKASLISARSPLMLKGTLKKPAPGVDVGALAVRGGAATALAFLVPPAALLAFIEPGLGAKSDCANFIRKMNRDTHTSIPVPPAPVSKKEASAKPAPLTPSPDRLRKAAEAY